MQYTAEPPTQTRPAPGLVPIDYGGEHDAAGIICGTTPSALFEAQDWVQAHAGEGITNAQEATRIAWAAASIAWVLMDNAVQHTASGLPGGRIQVELSRSGFLLTVAVTDSGSVPGRPFSFPDSGVARNGGLHRVEQLSMFWEPEMLADGFVTVRARLELP